MGRSNRQARVSAWCNFSTVNGVDRRVEREREREQQTKLAQGEKKLHADGMVPFKEVFEISRHFSGKRQKVTDYSCWAGAGIRKCHISTTILHPSRHTGKCSCVRKGTPSSFELQSVQRIFATERERERERGGNCRNLLRFKITLLRPVVVRPEGKFLHEGSSPLLSSLLSPPFITPENNYGQAIFHRVVMRIERCLSFSSSWKENNASLCN